ncbi:MAG: family 16 glycosylhydrolase [Ketobacteraceae bacterium]|nr:family 16 glycosylhydrolase [Ketobacteraceae bacterium]
MIKIKTLLSASLVPLLIWVGGCKESVELPARLQAEDYHGFFDTTAGNEGGVYQSDDVDIEVTTDSGGGFNVGWTDAGEYLRYNVSAAAGTYRARFRVATEQPDRRLRLKVDGVDVTGALSVPDTGGWQSWQNLDVDISLSGGNHTLEVLFDNGLVNLNWIDFSIAGDDPDPDGWHLVWRDEFDGARIDPAKWEHEVNGWGGGNNELQYYTARPENSYQSGGTLKIVARQESYTGPDGTRNYTSARLRTLNKGDWLYGRFEIRARMPHGQGLWPAIWMLPTDWVYGGWAASGEIDIMEAVNLQAGGGNDIHGTLHYGGPWPDNVHSGTGFTPSASVVNEFHTYAVEWEPGEIRWYVDGQHYQTQREWWSSAGAYPAPFNQRFHLILNVAVGGNWPGSPDGGTRFPQVMEVDYVRVYQR